MNNETTPLKGAFISLVTGLAMTHMGLNPLDAGALATGVWILASAAITYLLPANLGDSIGQRLGLRP